MTAVRGETLDDVALRLYGTRSMAGPLLEANRGLVDRTDRPLDEGLLLRLP